MGFLRTDYSDVNTGFKPLPIGEYECIISEVKVSESSTGKPMLKVTLTVRDDVEQEGGKRKFFDNVVEQENMQWKFQQIAKACALEEGLDIETLADFAGAIQYRNVRIKNKHEVRDGEKQDKIAYWLESKEDGMGGDGNTIEINDDDLPF